MMISYGHENLEHLIGYTMQFTEYKYLYSQLTLTCNVIGCSLCPHALFLQVRSHLLCGKLLSLCTDCTISGLYLGGGDLNKPI